MKFIAIHKTILTLLFISLTSVLVACGGGSSSSGGNEQSAERVPVTKLVAIGDSIAVGLAAGGPPWPDLLASGLGVPLVTEATSGEQTNYGLAVIENLLIEHKPSHVAILLGTNDSRVGSVQAAIDNLQAMADIARRNNVVPVIGTIPVLESNAHNNKAQQISDGILNISNANIARVRQSVGSDLSILADGIHPNAEGQQRISSAFQSAF